MFNINVLDNVSKREKFLFLEFFYFSFFDNNDVHTRTMAVKYQN
jgi:hypothetical protein